MEDHDYAYIDKHCIGCHYYAGIADNGSLWQIKTTRTKPRQIFFCPMCGRKLAAPPKGE